jgi:tRNA(Ile)-lysidine synthase
MVPGVKILRSFDWLRFSAAEDPATRHAYALSLSVPSVVEIPGSSTPISLELIDKPETILGSLHVYNREMGCIDWPRVSGPLELRNWRPGDKYQPIGHAGEEKIKRLFQVARIPVWERSGWPVLTDRAGIVWTRRFGPAAGVAPDSSTRTVLRIREIVKLESKTPQSASIKLG